MVSQCFGTSKPYSTTNLTFASVAVVKVSTNRRFPMKIPLLRHFNWLGEDRTDLYLQHLRRHRCQTIERSAGTEN